MRRGAVENFFSRKSITHLESRIHDNVRVLDSKLQALKGTREVVRLDHAASAFTGDIMGHFACGEHPHFLDGPGFTPEWQVLSQSTD